MHTGLKLKSINKIKILTGVLKREKEKIHHVHVSSIKIISRRHFLLDIGPTVLDYLDKGSLIIPTLFHEGAEQLFKEFRSKKSQMRIVVGI